MVVGAPSIWTRLPASCGSAPNTRCHRPWEITATAGPFGMSSSVVNGRPRTGATPSAVKNSALTTADVTRTGFSAPATLTRPVRHAPMALKERARSWSSRYSGGEIQNSSKPIVGN
jgi:hypothetical protein